MRYVEIFIGQRIIAPGIIASVFLRRFSGDGLVNFVVRWADDSGMREEKSLNYPRLDIPYYP